MSEFSAPFKAITIPWQELRRLYTSCITELSYFLQANAENQLVAQVTGKRKREVRLVVPAKFTAFTPELRNARILERELNGRASKYSHFGMKNIAINVIKLPKLS